ncbi:MAG: hypothetical protein WA734_12630 [Candidatus Acidiferrales bacterium]
MLPTTLCSTEDGLFLQGILFAVMGVIRDLNVIEAAICGNAHHPDAQIAFVNGLGGS